MNMFDWLNNKVKKMKWYDISCVKLAVFFVTLMLITVWPAFNNLVMGFAWYWYLILAIIFTLHPLMKMFWK